MGVNDTQLQSKSEVPTWNFFAPLRSSEMEDDHGDNTTVTATSGQAVKLPPIILTSQVNLIQLQRQLKVLMKGNHGTRVVMKEMVIFQPFTITSRATSSHISPSVPNPNSLQRV
jgi:hypothetical protein